MTIFKSKRAANQAQLAFKLSPVAAGCAVFLTVMAGSAYAQEAAQPAAGTVAVDSNGQPIQKVVVSGIRRGIEQAISIKKNSNSIVEAISAEDIGKLPDATVAESISRLPGVAAQRNKNTGRAEDISIRGLSGDFTATLLNGREQASSGDSRGVQFDLYPAEMMGSITVYKTPDASLNGGGIAATVDQHTVMPLDFPKRQVAASYKREKTGMHNDGLQPGSGYRTSLTYIDQFADRTIGIALGAVKFTDSGAEQYQADGWGGWTPKLSDVGATNATGDNSVIVPGGFKTDVQKIPKKQEGVMGILQFRPNKDFMTTLDVFHSKNNDNIKLTGFEGAVCGSTGPYDPSGVLTNATVVNGVATSGTCSNFKGDVRNHVDAITDTLDSWGLNARLRSDGWTFTGDISGSKVTHDSSRYETTAGQPGNATNLGSISWTGFNGKSNLSPTYTSSLNYADRASVFLTDQDGWGGGLTGNPQAGYVAIGVTTDKVNSFRWTAKHDLEFGPFTSVEFGLNHTTREKNRDQNEGNLIIPGGNPYGVATVPGSGTMVTPQSGIPVVMWDPNGSLGSIYALLPKVDQPIQTDKNWDVTEKVTTLYAMGNLDGQAMGLNYRGNVGGQFVHTNQSSVGYIVDTSPGNCAGAAGKPCPAYTISGGTKYNDFLPSANISFELPYDQMLRFGLAKTMSRPKMNDMRPGGGVSLNSTGANGSGPELMGGAGNPKLEPFRAKSFDVSYEKYFESNGAKGMFSAALFYKKLDTYILAVPKLVDFAATGFLSPNTPLPPSGSTVGVLTTPTNGSGGNIHGFELNASLPFGMATQYLDGFGLAVNYSNTMSSLNLLTAGLTVQDTGGVTTIPLPGLSRQVVNARLYYEAHGFQASVAARHRSNFLGQMTDFQDNPMLTFIKGNTTVDLQAGYEFSSGMLKGMSILAAVQNWTNTPFQRYAAKPENVVENLKFGRTYSLGASYKF